MMKKLITVVAVLALILSMGVTAFADDLVGPDDLTVTFTANKKIVDNLNLYNAAEEMQPGDTLTINIALRNKFNKSVEWYLQNTIINSLEDNDVANGGAYSYELTYLSSTGEETVIFSSGKVGGKVVSGNTEEPVGMHVIDNGLKDEYMYLETMNRGGKSTLTLKITMEGESQGNSYQDSKGQLAIKFAAEPVRFRPYVPTGDRTSVTPYVLAGGGSALLLILLALYGRKQKKEKEEKQA